MNVVYDERVLIIDEVSVQRWTRMDMNVKLKDASTWA